MSIAYKTGLATSAVVRLFTKATTKVVTDFGRGMAQGTMKLSLIHISEPTRPY